MNEITPEFPTERPRRNRAVSVDAVAEKAGLTKRTLYYHFKSKDDLVAAYLAARDGSFAVVQLHRDPSYMETAGEAAFALVDAARKARPPKRK